MTKEEHLKEAERLLKRAERQTSFIWAAKFTDMANGHLKIAELLSEEKSTKD